MPLAPRPPFVRRRLLLLLAALNPRAPGPPRPNPTRGGIRQPDATQLSPLPLAEPRPDLTEVRGIAKTAVAPKTVFEVLRLDGWRTSKAPLWVSAAHPPRLYGYGPPRLMGHPSPHTAAHPLRLFGYRPTHLFSSRSTRLSASPSTPLGRLNDSPSSAGDRHGRSPK